MDGVGLLRIVYVICTRNKLAVTLKDWSCYHIPYSISPNESPLTTKNHGNKNSLFSLFPLIGFGPGARFRWFASAGIHFFPSYVPLTPALTERTATRKMRFHFRISLYVYHVLCPIRTAKIMWQTHYSWVSITNHHSVVVLVNYHVRYYFLPLVYAYLTSEWRIFSIKCLTISFLVKFPF